MITNIILFIASFLTWQLLCWSLDFEHIILGIGISLIISFIAGDMFKANALRKSKRYFWFLVFFPVFIWECIKANIDGVLKLANPNLPIKPGIVKVKTSIKSEAGLTFLANALTLKTGTMTVDIDKEKGFLYVHWIDVKSCDIDKATELIVRRFESILKRIF